MQDVHKVAVDASGDKIPLNEDKDEGPTTARDASPDLIARGQEGNSKVGGSKEGEKYSRPSNQKKKAVSIASLLSEYIGHAPASEKATEATERSKEDSLVQNQTL